jgi:NADPH2:quinone reductase
MSVERQTVICITGAGGPEVLKPTSASVPQPDADELLIRVSSAGVNRHDCHQRASGTIHDGNPVPGLEVSGEVVAAGRNVAFCVGDRVMALVQGGGYAEYVVSKSAVTFHVPSQFDDDEAAALPEALFTTWWNFFGLMTLEKEEYALVHGGTSGVGHIALQVLSALGFRALATAGTDEKVAAAKRFGAHLAFRYDDPDLSSKVRDATDNRGISALLDMSAGAHFAHDLEMMADDGRIAHLSGGGGKRLDVPLQKIMAKRIRLTGSLLRPLPPSMKAAVAAGIKERLWPLVGTEIRPTIFRKFGLCDAAAAHEEMEKNKHIGKIVLKVRG